MAVHNQNKEVTAKLLKSKAGPNAQTVKAVTKKGLLKDRDMLHEPNANEETDNSRLPSTSENPGRLRRDEAPKVTFWQATLH